MVLQPVEARILENAPRGAREREFSFLDASRWKQIKVQTWDSHFGSAGESAFNPRRKATTRGTTVVGAEVGTLRKKRDRPEPRFAVLLPGGSLHGSKNTQLMTPRGDRLLCSVTCRETATNIYAVA